MPLYLNPAPNNGLHPTRDTAALININLAGGRVMPGARLLELTVSRPC